MATDYTNSEYTETIFDADEYGSEATSGTRHTAPSSSGSSRWDQTFKRYQPPHKRGVNLEMGDHVQVAGLRPNGDLQGVDNASFQKLIVYVSFALVKEMVAKLSSAFPGMFFVSKCHDNHDHPFSHVVTQVGTRLLQRMFVPGSRILDVYGSPLACQKFNGSQARARLPKHMEANVFQTGGTNFIREVNKWGPMWPANGPPNYHRSSVAGLGQLTLRHFDCFQLIHTLYYLSNTDLIHLLHSQSADWLPGAASRKKALALIHSHSNAVSGTINHGEQRYVIRNGIVKQTNVSTNSSYCHPNITPFWFQEKKEFYNDDGIGFVWELHTVCQDTWIVEIVAARRDQIDVFENDWEAMFDLGEFDHLVKTKSPAYRRPEAVLEMLPTKSGVFMPLDLNNMELVSSLRAFATGKPRTGLEGAKLMKELIAHARNLVFPSSLYPDRAPMTVKQGTMIDHVASAFLTDVERETNIVTLMDSMQGLIYNHSMALTGKRPSTLAGADWMGTLRILAKVGVSGVKAARNKDPIGSALGQVENFLM